MIERIIAWCAANRFLVCTATVALLLWGLWALGETPLDAVPDISDVQVIVATSWDGRSPDLIEDQVTYPIVTALLSTPRVRTVRGFTDFGISYVYVIFEDGTDMYWARSRVLEYLQGIRGLLPDGVNPAIGPDATGVGWVFEYALVDETGEHSLADLRSFQDWHLRYWLAGVPGVAEVATIGGFVKQYQVNLDPNRLAAYDLSVKDVVRAIQASNNEVAGRLLEFAGREYMVRSRAYLTSAEDIEQIALGADAGGIPVRVADVAQVRVGPDIRRGVAELDGRGEVVGGIVVMRFGENALGVIDRVKARLLEVRSSLPPGVTIVPTYDRSTLIRDAIGNLGRTLVEEAVVVSAVIVLFLFHFRSALIPILVLPIAIVASFVPMYYLGVSANIMSLGGIALAIGVLVDAAIVMVENAYRRVSEDDDPNGWRPERQRQIVVDAARQVGRPIFFSLAIIIISFVPVFLLEAQEGRMFRPLAFTKTFVMVFASVLSITLVPVLMTIFIRGRRFMKASRNPLIWLVTRIYEPILRLALRWRWAALILNFALVPLTLPLLSTIGSEFMPPLYEGSMLYMPTAPPGLPVGEATRLLQVQDKLLAEFPEVERVFGTVGRGTTPTDNSPMGMVNTTITLKPREEWRPGMTMQRLQTEMDEALQFPGVPNVWTQPIRNRLDMLLTGIKTPVGIKVFGTDLNVIQSLGERIEEIAQGVEGTRSVYAERVAQGYFTDIRIDRTAIARHGLTVEDVQDVIQSALGGQTVTRTIEGRERYSVNVRYARSYRETLPAIEQVLVRTAIGSHIPLGQLATVELTPGPAMVRDKDGQLAGYVYVDTETRDIGGYVERLRQAIGEELTLPPGYTLLWTGQYEFQVRARERLQVLIPIVFFVIFMLLYVTFQSASEAVAIMLSVVYAMTGGVFLQWWLGYNFSVAVWVGYIALYGVAVQTGVVMVTYLHEALDALLRRGGNITEAELRDATISGSVLRLRPKLMTVSVVMAGLLPIMWSTGVGADVMKPIAAPIIGGMVTSTLHVLIITPVIFYLMKRRALRRGTLTGSPLGRHET
ncbi:MAG: CusA/CzcA family heavy metal efflux RND transporter [Vicinamibacterales bacterium]|jgi:Cu(I)/Ag(I) efflux system membrane protein CusA/SilA|nr:CusA/CzcA family heavy metal efflux RND transporter [Vicinamibacterales bacterium]MDP7480403.1 CusA/CzcA family heavy metal efflux RND transporter [Vicinamibacterales bacterium]HJN43919.1 CusA/CzcA family heavy metal efflux RND transporter [Vicinamibacterales bacterium]